LIDGIGAFHYEICYKKVEIEERFYKKSQFFIGIFFIVLSILAGFLNIALIVHILEYWREGMEAARSRHFVF